MLRDVSWLCAVLLVSSVVVGTEQHDTTKEPFVNRRGDQFSVYGKNITQQGGAGVKPATLMSKRGTGQSCPSDPTAAVASFRQQLCRLHEAYSDLCYCGDALWGRQRALQLDDWAMSNVPTIIISSRPKSLFRTLRSLAEADGSNKSPLLVITPNDPETIMLLEVRNVSVAVTHAAPLKNPASTIAQQYLIALGHVLQAFPNQDYFIFLEDDILVSPDFYRFMNVSAELLAKDKSLYCASAHNDISYQNTSFDASAVIRTESYNNLGWMARRQYIEDLYRFLKDYPPNQHFYDWDIMAYKHVRGGRECIIPEVSRSKHVGAGGAHESIVPRIFFDDKNYNTRRQAWITDVRGLERKLYERELRRLLSSATFLEPSRTNPCLENFSSEVANKNNTFVLFFHMPRAEEFSVNKPYKLLMQCLGVFFLHAREGHHGLYRLRQGSSHLMLIGLPYSRYSQYRPPHVGIFYYSEQLKKQVESQQQLSS